MYYIGYSKKTMVEEYRERAKHKYEQYLLKNPPKSIESPDQLCPPPPAIPKLESDLLLQYESMMDTLRGFRESDYININFVLTIISSVMSNLIGRLSIEEETCIRDELVIFIAKIDEIHKNRSSSVSEVKIISQNIKRICEMLCLDIEIVEMDSSKDEEFARTLEKQLNPTIVSIERGPDREPEPYRDREFDYGISEDDEYD